MGDSWSRRVRESLTPIEGMVYSLNGVDFCQRYTLARVVAGWNLGLLDSRSVVSIEVERMRGSKIQSSSEMELAVILGDELWRVESIVTVLDVAYSPSDLFWFGEILRIFWRRWASGHGEPVLEFLEFTDAWGRSVDAVAVDLAPRGVDAIFMGKSATRRFVGRVGRWLESLELQSLGDASSPAKAASRG
jgi:hypothetical protein